MNKIPMTATGAKLLENELHELKSVARPQVIEAIAEARAHGDLKENAEYHEAKRQQSFIEGRIIEIEAKLSNAQIIDITKMPHTGKVIFGTTVRVINTETDEELVYKIVGDDESDIKLGKISVSSPIARALIGKEEGDVANVQTPNGLIEYELVKVEYI